MFFIGIIDVSCQILFILFQMDSHQFYLDCFVAVLISSFNISTHKEFTLGEF